MRDWTAAELAAKAGVSDARIRQLLTSGIIQGYKRTNAWFIPDEEAQKFLAKRAEEDSKKGEEGQK